MYTIHEVCEKTGLTAYTLRYYEKEGLLPNVSRSQGGFRQYSDEDLDALDLICCLKNTGMPLSDIARLMEIPRNTAAHLAVPFPTSAACRFLDLPPGFANPFSLKTVHWTVFRALEPSKPSKSAIASVE